MKILYTKSEIMNSFEKIIDDVLLHNSKIKPGNISEIIMTDLLGIGKMIFSLWFQNIIGTGYKRSKIFMKTDTGDHRVKINMFKFNGLKTKNYLSRFGYITLQRAYYCGSNGGYFPIEEEYPWLKDDFLPDVKEIACYVSMLEPYDLASDMLEKMNHIKISPSSLQRITKQTGAYFVENADKNIEADIIDSREPEKKSDLLVVSIDGAHIHTKDDGWKEVRTGAVYEVKRMKDKKLHAINKSYHSKLESAEDSGKRLWMEARRRNMHLASKIVVIGDGAKWIWKLQEKHFPNGIAIVDWYHAVEHLWKISEMIFGNRSSDDGKLFIEDCKTKLYIGAVSLLEERIRSGMNEMPLNRLKSLKNDLETEINYFKNNATKMNYKKFEEQNFPIGSGVIEGACKHVVQLRMKRNSMKWTISGANDMLQLRSLYFSNRWNEVTAYLEKVG